MANRPLSFESYVGQERIKNQLKITIGANKRNGTQLPHMLLSGNPGLGKTTLSKVISQEFGVTIHEVLASNLKSVEDIEKILANLEDDGRNILFIDEIHRMPMHVEEALYSVMEDFVFEKEAGSGKNKKIQQFWVPEFTLIGATTLAGNISRPLRDRFGLNFLLQNYDEDEICSIIDNLAKREEIEIEEMAIVEIAKRAKGVARLAINYFYRCKEYADFISGDGVITYNVSKEQFDLMGIDEMGLDENDFKVLEFLAGQPTPIGIDALANGIDIDKNTVATIIEPFLIQKKLIFKTRSGRAISNLGEKWIYRNDTFS